MLLQYGSYSTQWLIFAILVFIVSLLVITIFLKLALGMIDKAKHTDFGDVFGTTLLVLLILNLLTYFLGLIGLILGAIIGLAVISSRHRISFLMAVVVVIIAFIIFIIVIFAIGLIIGTAIYTLY